MAEVSDAVQLDNACEFYSSAVRSLNVCFQCSKLLLHCRAEGKTDKSWISCALSPSSNMVGHNP
jgi:hypothetical protein